MPQTHALQRYHFVRAKAKSEKRKSALKPFRHATRPEARNAPCACGSGYKYKKCCGKPAVMPVFDSPYMTLAAQYTAEQIKAEREFIKQWGFRPNPAKLMAFMAGDMAEIKEEILRVMRKVNAEPRFIAAVDKLEMLVSSHNEKLISLEAAKAWKDATGE